MRKRREVGRPNIGFWDQLIKYEIRIRGKASTRLVTSVKDGVTVTTPDFYKSLFPELYEWEAMKQVKEAKAKQSSGAKIRGEKVYNPNKNTYE